MRASLVVFAVCLIGCDAAVEPPAGVPDLGAPTGLSVTAATATTVSLRWLAPEGPVDRVEVRTGCTSDCPDLYPDELAVLQADADAYTVEGLSDVGAHQFQVVAVSATDERLASRPLRVEYPGGGVLSAHPLPASTRAYLTRGGEYVYAVGATASDIVEVDAATGAVAPLLYSDPTAAYEAVVTTQRSDAFGGARAVLVADTAPAGGWADGAQLAPRRYTRQSFEDPGGRLLFEQPGLDGVSIGPPNLAFVVGSYEGASGRTLTAWRRGVDMTLAADLVAGFASAVPIGATSEIGVLVLLEPGTGNLHGVYIGGPGGPREAWRRETDWTESSDIVPQLDGRLEDLAFTSGGRHVVVDASSGQETMSAPAGPGEAVVALGGGVVVVSDGGGLRFIDAASGDPLRRVPERPAPMDRRIAVEGRHVVAVSRGVATVIVEAGGALAVRRWALDAVWREAPAQ